MPVLFVPGHGGSHEMVRRPVYVHMHIMQRHDYVHMHIMHACGSEHLAWHEWRRGGRRQLGRAEARGAGVGGDTDN